MSEMLSQDEIDALLGGSSTASEEEVVLTPEEKDTLGEVGNISMGTAATTLFTLLGQKVAITTPQVQVTSLREMADNIKLPFVVINIQYREGLQGLNLLILQEKDVKIITDLMMGNDGTNLPDELTDLHLSAICEAMNQMIGSASTSLSELLKMKIDISPPEAVYSDIASLDFDSIGVDPNAKVARTSFRMTIGDLIDSEIMQIQPLDIAKQLVSTLHAPAKAAPTATAADAEFDSLLSGAMPAQSKSAGAARAPQETAHPERGGNYSYVTNEQTAAPVHAKPFQFDQFQDEPTGGMIAYASDIEIIKDVPLEITVELGRTKKKISDILAFGVGSVIELERLVGEPLDILANGKNIAKGEVVVVDEYYGIRLTEILTPTKNK